MKAPDYDWAAFAALGAAHYDLVDLVARAPQNTNEATRTRSLLDWASGDPPSPSVEAHAILRRIGGLGGASPGEILRLYRAAVVATVRHQRPKLSPGSVVPVPPWATTEDVGRVMGSSPTRPIPCVSPPFVRRPESPEPLPPAVLGAIVGAGLGRPADKRDSYGALPRFHS